MASEKKQANVKSLLQLISRQENILLLGYGKISHPALETGSISCSSCIGQDFYLTKEDYGYIIMF